MCKFSESIFSEKDVKMKYYIDNFRGFQQQIVEMDKVSFLVGENSSGKTSLLRAISIISDMRFLMAGEITLEESDFCSFDDLVSARSFSQEFSLGLIDEKQKMIEILTFGNDEGLPKCTSALFYLNESVVSFCLKKDVSKYAFKANVSFDEVVEKIGDEKNLMGDVTWREFDLSDNTPFSILLTYLASKDRDIRLAFYKKTRGFPYIMFIPCLFEAPIRAKPQKIYSGAKVSYSAEGIHTPFVIKKALKEKNKKIELLSEFGRNSGLFDSIKTTNYGNHNTAPFELVVTKGKCEYSISSVGYGVSQILPIVVDMIFSSEEMILIQQPEVHLHPKAQAAFGDFLFKISQSDPNRKFVIETHSDYIIDRYRYLMKKSKSENSSGRILFTKNKEGRNNIQIIPFDKDGSYACEDISEYREFFIDESLKMMEF